MTNVQEAAAKIRDLSGDVADCLGGGMPHDTLTYRGSLLHELLQAALTVTKALELVPADDAEPLDAPFVESVGLRWAKFGYYWPGWPAGMQINGVDGDAWLYVANEPIVSLKTRGDLRALLKGLKLPLSPATRQEPT